MRQSEVEDWRTGLIASSTVLSLAVKTVLADKLFVSGTLPYARNELN